MRGKKALYNSMSSLLVELITILSGFILPRAILSTFGSTYNGLTTSITQFLSIVTLLRAGIGGVTKAAMYKPLAENNIEQISAIVNATQKFMKRIAWIFAIGLVVFAFCYPLLVRESFDYWFSCSLVLIMGVSTFFQYYFAITYQMLLIADQRQYVHSVIYGITLILNLIVTVSLIKLGCGIHVIKLGTTIVYCLNPAFIHIYVRRTYKLRRDVKPDNSAILQRWDAVAHQLAAYVQDNTDIMVLTVFTTITEVSVYSVYYLVANGVKKLLATLTAGVESVFGNMMALNDYDSVRRNMSRIEFLMFSVGTVAYSCLFILIVPFIKVYTSGITDVEYARPVFALLLTATQFVGCVRTPYQNLVDAAGHFKQTKSSAVIEASLNLAISVLAVARFGIIGVVVGTLISTIYRTVYLVIYASRKILQIFSWSFLKRMLCSLMEMVVIFALVNAFVNVTVTDYLSWFLCALNVGMISLLVVLAASLVFDRQAFGDCAKRVLLLLKVR